MTKEELCLACHLFTESVGQYICKFVNEDTEKPGTDKFGIVNGTSLRDINTEMLKFLEQEHITPKFRPLLVSSPELNLPVFKINDNIKGNKACCKIQDKRYTTTITATVNEMREKILMDARLCAEKYLADKINA